MIWGDQHEPRFFEFFLEKNILFEFYDILASSVNRRGEIAKQVLQTLSIMISNMRKETSVFYLFSNNHINNIIQLDFDFSDEEVLAFYISFLKSISLKLNIKTIHFFFQKSDDGQGAGFPLYTEAIRFVGNKEAMVRAAVRTLTLNIYSVDDEEIQAFIVSKPASNYFTELALYAAEQCQALDRFLLEAETTLDDNHGPLDSQIDRIEDMLSYFNDIFLTGSEVLRSRLASCLWEYFISPALFWPLLEVGSRSKGETSRYRSSISANGVTSGGVSRAVTSLCVIERIVHLIESPILSQAIACCLLAGERSEADGCSKLSTTCQFDLQPTTPYPSYKATSAISPVSDAGLDRVNSTYLKELFVQYRFSFLRCLSGDSIQIGTAAVRVLVALIMHPSIPSEILEICGVLPARARIRETLINELTAEADEDPSPLAAPRSASSLSPVQQTPVGTRSWKSSKPIRFLKGLSSRTVKKEVESSCEKEIESSDDDAESNHQSTGELLTALCQLTALPTLPPLTISYIAWIVCQLTFPSPGPKASDECMDSVETALMVSRTSVDDEMRGIWSDALLPLISQQWIVMLKNAREPKLRLSSVDLMDWIFSQKASEVGSAVYNNQGSVSSQQLAVRLRLSYSAQCAFHILYKVQRLISLVQLRQSLIHGKINDESGVPPVSLDRLMERELKEKCDIDMSGVTSIPCTVSFSPGQEQLVYYCLYGTLNPSSSYETTTTTSTTMTNIEDNFSVNPSVILVTPAPTRIKAGFVMSAAPVISSDPQIDPRHYQWLHLRVRPTIVRFLSVSERCSTSSRPPWVHFRELHDGHWILAFATPAEAATAKHMTQECIAKMAAIYCDVLAPILSSTDNTIDIEQQRYCSITSSENRF
eukprot:g5316.t1